MESLKPKWWRPECEAKDSGNYSAVSPDSLQKKFSRGDLDENHVLGNRKWQLLLRGDPNGGPRLEVFHTPFISIGLPLPMLYDDS